MDMTPPDPVCKYCDDTCSGTCEGAREAIEQAKLGDCPTCAANGKPHFGWCGWKYPPAENEQPASEDDDSEG